MIRPFSFLTQSVRQTKKLGEFLAHEISRLNQAGRKNALILSLQGDLGSGKTTFVQGFTKGLGIKQKVLSPSFLIIKGFTIKAAGQRGNKVAGWQGKQGFKRFFHIDLYRLKKAQELLKLDFKDILKAPENIVAIEWGKKAGQLLPQRTLRVYFEHVSPKERRISFLPN